MMQMSHASELDLQVFVGSSATERCWGHPIELVLEWAIDEEEGLVVDFSLSEVHA